MTQEQVQRVIELQNSNMQRGRVNMQRHVDKVVFTLNGKKSVEYARARSAINQDCFELFSNNAAGAKNFKGDAKRTAIEFLGGKIQWEQTDEGKKKFVLFPDESKARY